MHTGTMNKKTQVRVDNLEEYSIINKKYWYTAKIPRRCTACKERIKIGMTYFILPGTGVLCSDCGQEHLKKKKRELIGFG